MKFWKFQVEHLESLISIAGFLVQYIKFHRLINTNIVRNLDKVGQWRGEPVDFTVSIVGKKGDGGCAVLVQKVDNGPILAAAVLPYQGK